MKFLLSSIFLLLALNSVASQSANCDYRDDYYDDNHYGCNLTANGEFNSINGQHIEGKTDTDVESIISHSPSNFDYFPSVICEKFINLKVIDFRKVGIKTIHSDSLILCNHLEELALISNEIKILPENFTGSQIKLRKLWLHRNRIEFLPNGIFDSLTNLEFLSLSHNKLTSLNENVFKSLTNLHYLNLNYNNITEFPDKIFAPLTKLKQLWINDNNITILHSTSFGIHEDLFIFDFNSRQFNSFDERIITENMPELQSTDGGPNLCNKSDEYVTRDNIFDVLKKCFENYKNEFSN